MADERHTHKGRSRKRPGPSGDPGVSQRILDAAEYLFATQGFAATSIRQIAERVDVNPAMVHYYFGSKHRLLQAVMDGVLEPIAGALAELERSGGSIRDAVGLMLSLAAAHPYLPQLITREVFLSGGDYQQEFVQHFAPRLGGRLPRMLEREQREGRVAAGLETNILALLVLSLCFFPFIARPAAESALAVSFDAEGMRSLSAHISGLLERGIGP